jgi:hypothetical protein
MFSRTIKYLVIQIPKYSAYDLNDQRLHAIGLYAGQDTSVEDPEDADATYEGIEPTDDTLSWFDDITDIVIAGTIWWWTGWWPLLHLKNNCTLATGESCNHEMTVDLLGMVSIIVLEIYTPAYDYLTETQLESIYAQGWDEFLQDMFPSPHIVYLLIASAAFGILQIFLAKMSKLPSLATIVILGILVTIYVIAITQVLLAVRDGVVIGSISPGSAIPILIGILLMCGLGCIANYFKFAKIMTSYWTTQNFVYGLRSTVFILVSFFLVIAQFFLSIITLVLLAVLLTASVGYYDL